MRRLLPLLLSLALALIALSGASGYAERATAGGPYAAMATDIAAADASDSRERATGGGASFIAAPGAFASVAAANCQFVLGFLTLQQMIPSQVGDCLSDVQFSPANGDALQPTTGPTGQGGLLVWRKSDNFTAFTDGFRTWINGPFGLQTRLNSQRFFWERNLERLPVVPPQVSGDRCHTAGLAAGVQRVAAAAGNVFATFTLTNTQNVSCAFFGYVGAQLLDAQNDPLPTRVVPSGGSFTDLPGPALVLIPAGGSATFQMHWGDVPVGNEATCPTSATLAITPPDEVDSIPVAIRITACGGGRIDVSPITAPTNLSNNWSGYAASGGTFTTVAGTWTVARPRNVGPSASATWVGIGGLRSRDLIQTGTQDSNDASGEVSFGAWFELLPAPPRTVPLAVRPGDSISASISAQGADHWLIRLVDNTSGQSFETVVVYSSSLSSAEWIQEAPSLRGRILPLDDFGTIRFTGGMTTRNGETMTIAQAGAQPISMIDAENNVIATPSALVASGDGFTVARTTP